MGVTVVGIGTIVEAGTEVVTRVLRTWSDGDIGTIVVRGEAGLLGITVVHGEDGLLVLGVAADGITLLPLRSDEIQ